MTIRATPVSSHRLHLWYAHVGIIVTAEFAAEASRGLVLPTLFSYAQHLGGDLVFMGLLTSLFSAGRFASSLLLGILSDRMSFKTLYHISAIIGIVGNVLYVLPYSRHVNSKALLGVSRFVIGFGAGNRSVCRANIAALTRLDQRTSYFTLLATVVFLAYALTPGLGGIFGDIDFFVGGSEYFPFNQLTAPGYVLVALNLLAMAVNALVYDDSVSRDDAPVQESGEKQREERKAQTSSHQPASHDTITTAAVVFTILNFNVRGILSIFETVNVPLYLKTLNQTSSGPTRVFDPISTFPLAYYTAISSSIAATQSSEAIAHAARFFLMIGLLGLVSYGAVIWLGGARGRVSDTNFLLFGFGSLFAGNAGLFVVSSWFTSGSRDHFTISSVFLVAEILVWSVGCPIASAVIVPAFSKALGTRPQGKLMGVFGASASISRMLLPFLPGVLPSWELLFLVNMVLCLGSIALLEAYDARNTRRDHNKRSQDDASQLLEDLVAHPA